MANERRLIDANELREDWLLYGANENIYSTNDILDSIDAAPTVDAVEVCYCKDCKWAKYEKDYSPYCNHLITGLFANIKDEDFCSYGEKRCE